MLATTVVALVLVYLYHLNAAAILVALVGGVPVLYLAWMAYRQAEREPEELNLGEISDALATAIGAQWQDKARVQRLNDPYPLPVAWGPADANLADSWDMLVRLATSGAGWPPPAGTWAADPGDLAGSGGDLVDVLARVPTGRLVVLGEPGTGKTTLMVRLVLDLLARRAPDGPVPVLVSLATWNPAAEDLRDWLAAQLTRDHPALAATAPRSLGGNTRAGALLAAGLILPILDGLDEVPSSLLSATISRINDSLRPGTSVVVTSRTADYKRAVWSPGGTDVTLRAAAVVELRRLDMRTVGDYLKAGANTAEGRARWDDVLVRLGPETPLAHVLSNPQMISLASIIYNPRPGEDTGALSKPTELLDLADETAIERKLLDAFISSVYRDFPRGGRQAERWFTFIAQHLQRLGTPDLAWWHLSAALRRKRQSLALLGSSVIGFALLVAWLGLGLGLGRKAWPGSNIETGFLVFVILTAMSAVAILMRKPRQPNQLTALDPISVLRRARMSAIIQALVSGFSALLALILIPRLFNQELAFAVASVGACYVAVIFAMTTVWGNFQLARVWCATQDKLPFLLFAFLDDAERRGVLRRAGPVYQFRHVLLQEVLADPARAPGIRHSIQYLTDWALENLEIQDASDSVRAERGDIEQAVNAVVTNSLDSGGGFKADAVVRQEVLERVRLRLNELGRRSLFSKSLMAQRAPGLGAVLNPAHVILTDAMREVERLAGSVSSASIGISGVRGVGKSTLIRWICEEKDSAGRLPMLGLYVTAPVEYDPRDFLIHLYTCLCQAVLEDDRLTSVRSAWKYRIRRHMLGVVAACLAVTSAAAFFHLEFGRVLDKFWTVADKKLWEVVALGALTAAVLFAISYFRHLQTKSYEHSIDAIARDRLRRLRYQITETTGLTGKITGSFGLALSGSRSRAITENQMTLPELVADYRLFAEGVVSSLQDRAQQSGTRVVTQARLIVGIDEIDRIESAEHAEKFLNEIKAIFGVPYCFYVASLSADALATFERRAVTARTTFDTAFDTMVRLDLLELRTARQLLERRAIGLPYPFVALCHVLSGGVPRELMRVARSVFDVRNSSGNARQNEVECKIIADEVIVRELHSIRQGLLPLAAKLTVPGAADLIALLDDRQWPTGDLTDDVARMSKVFAKADKFADARGGTAAAAKICDSFVAAVFFFLTVQEVFSSEIDRVIKDLMKYDSIDDDLKNVSPSLQLLVNARAVLAVNPYLAASRVHRYRMNFKLSTITPVFVSQAMIGEPEVDASPRGNSSSNANSRPAAAGGRTRRGTHRPPGPLTANS